jgi:hypothetical protein
MPKPVVTTALRDVARDTQVDGPEVRLMGGAYDEFDYQRPCWVFLDYKRDRPLLLDLLHACLPVDNLIRVSAERLARHLQ